MERSSIPDQEHSTGELVKMMSEQVSVLIRDELKLAQLEMTSKGKQAALGAGMFGASGVVAVYGWAACWRARSSPWPACCRAMWATICGTSRPLCSPRPAPAAELGARPVARPRRSSTAPPTASASRPAAVANNA